MNVVGSGADAVSQLLLPGLLLGGGPCARRVLGAVGRSPGEVVRAGLKDPENPTTDPYVLEDDESWSLLDETNEIAANTASFPLW